MTLKLRLNERKLGVHSSSSSSKPAVGRRKEAETPTSLLQCSIYPATQPTSLKLDSNGRKSTHLTFFVTQLVIFSNISTSLIVCRFFPKPKDNQPYSPFDSFSLSLAFNWDSFVEPGQDGHPCRLTGCDHPPCQDLQEAASNGLTWVFHAMMPSKKLMFISRIIKMRIWKKKKIFQNLFLKYMYLLTMIFHTVSTTDREILLRLLKHSLYIGIHANQQTAPSCVEMRIWHSRIWMKISGNLQNNISSRNLIFF